MKKVSSEALIANLVQAVRQPAAPTGSRITAAREVRGAAPAHLGELPLEPGAARPALRARDLDTEVGRTAFAMGRKRGFEEGARAGMNQGFSEGSQALSDFQSRKAADVARQMQQLVDAFRAELALLESQVASDLVSLAVDIARQVLRRELHTDPQALLPAASEALRALGEGAGRMELRCNPADAAMLRAHLEQQPGVAAWQVREDDTLARGGCRIEADTGVADASFEARWQSVMASLGRDEEPLP